MAKKRVAKKRVAFDLLSNGISSKWVYLAIPLVLSGFTHLWNPLGFPSIHIDETHYMRRAMLVMKNLGPYDPYYQYDHPFFGQIFLS